MVVALRLSHRVFRVKPAQASPCPQRFAANPANLLPQGRDNRAGTMPVRSQASRCLSSALIHELPTILALERKVNEIDDVAMMRVCRTVIDFLAADIRKDALGVARVFGDESPHLG